MRNSNDLRREGWTNNIKFSLKVVQTGFSLLFLALVLFTVSCTKNNQNIFFVSPTGNDTNPGTLKEPLATIVGARNKIRELKKEHETTYKVYLREGIYFVDESIEFGINDGGSSENPIIYQRYKDEKIVFSGGKRIKSSLFKPLDNKSLEQSVIDQTAAKKILQVDLKSLGIEEFGNISQHGFSTAIQPAQMELFIENDLTMLARWPNESVVPIVDVLDPGSKPKYGDFTNRGGKIKYDFDRPSYWTTNSNIWTWGYFGRGYADDNMKIKEIDTARQTIKFEQASMYGIVKSNPNEEWASRITGFYVYNLPEEIDQPGEYYIDRETGILYVYPPQNFESSVISVSITESPLVSIKNCSHLTLDGFIFENGRGIGLHLEGGDAVQVSNCTFRNFGTIAIMMGKGIKGPIHPIHEFTGELQSGIVGNLKAHLYENTDMNNFAGINHMIINCKAYNLGSGGIVLSGGDRKKLEKGNNQIRNCDIYNYNRRNKTYCPAITILGVGNKIVHNFIHDAPHQAIAIYGNDHLIEYNHIEKVVKYVNDMGAVYMGRNPSETGNIIRYNFFDNLGTDGYKNCAIMLDDCAGGTIVYGNVFYKASKYNMGDILINGGSHIDIDNNIFINGANALWLENPGFSRRKGEKIMDRYTIKGLFGTRCFIDIDINSLSWKEKYPNLKPFNKKGEFIFLEGNKMRNNLIINENLIISKQGLDTSNFKLFNKNKNLNIEMSHYQDNIGDLVKKMNQVMIDYSKDYKPIPFNQIGPIHPFNEFAKH